MGRKWLAHLCPDDCFLVLQPSSSGVHSCIDCFLPPPIDTPSSWSRLRSACLPDTTRIEIAGLICSRETLPKFVTVLGVEYQFCQIYWPV
ncbi:hypothetical protein PVAP13_2KG179200 [Panicum virgatum]|uniref:Uncharacterized protein n=1 Tax=Panicum virgatum TaxID=38727 RepID=A0A8T0WDM8_PANVG|nr:hypothetical protein PVAP13_2KG179200 [Panicum virgatum]